MQQHKKAIKMLTRLSAILGSVIIVYIWILVFQYGVESIARAELRHFMEAIESNDKVAIEQYIGSPEIISLDPELRYEEHVSSFFSRFSYRVINNKSFFDQGMFVATIRIRTRDASAYMDAFKDSVKQNLKKNGFKSNEALFYEAMNASRKMRTTETMITGFRSGDSSWSIYISDNFADAVYGGLIEASK